MSRCRAVRDGLGDIQSIIVFGGDSDIARATVARLLLRRCRTVVLAVRHPDRVRPFDPPAPAEAAITVVPFDAAAIDSHGASIEAAWAAAGTDVDVVLVAFGQLGDQGQLEHDPAAAAALSHINYVGSVSVLLHVAERLRRQGHGTIVLLSSVAGVRVRRANFVYGASKAGVDAFAQGLADSLVGSGVNVVIVRPGFVRTKMTAGMPDMPFAVGPEAVAAAIEAGIRRRQAIVWAPAILQPVFTVMRLLPRALWRRLPR
jgi:decaprenylphospho-beta-D-erythro-pentofuranosid-2-ulose 2-reductase